MTALGKIMTFLCLLLSLVQGGLTIAVYVAATRWPAKFAELEKNYKAAQASSETYRTERDKALATQDVKANAVADELRKVRAELAAAAKQNDDLVAEKRDFQKKFDAADVALSANKTEVQRRQADVERISAELTTQTKKNSELVDANNALRGEVVDVRIALNTATDRLKGLTGQVEELAKANNRLKNPAATGALVGRDAWNPPAVRMDGLVKETEPDGTMLISLGGDAGLERGHTLHLFRLAKVAEQSEYLGKVRITSVEAHQAVAQPVGRINGVVRKGDTVSSSIN